MPFWKKEEVQPADGQVHVKPGLVDVPSSVKPFADGVVPQQQRGADLVESVQQQYEDAKKKKESGQQ
ncbi:MAG TPA: hypothetical protein VFG51_03040 [Candidatus Saccharimonadia bacterium]|nr:hypothetical protein [Candidatus Saccharimonadia bacterium]